MVMVDDLAELVDDIGGGTDPKTSKYVEPISPHLISDQVVYVPGVCDSISEGFPAVLLHGPLLPLSSQFIYCPPSFQILNTNTIPAPRASPIVVRPPRLAAAPSLESHHAAVIESRPVDGDTGSGITTPFWTYKRLISVNVPVVVLSLV